MKDRRKDIYAVIKILKYCTNSSIKSYMAKFAMEMSVIVTLSHTLDMGSAIRRVLNHWSIRGQFSSVHPDLRKEGIRRVEVVEEGLHFIRNSDIDKTLDWTEKQEAVRKKESGNVAYKKKDFCMAISNYEQAIQLDLEDMTSWSNLGAVMFETAAFREVSSVAHVCTLTVHPQCSWLCKMAVRVGERSQADQAKIARARDRASRAEKQLQLIQSSQDSKRKGDYR